MRLSLRLIISLIVAVTLVSFFFAMYQSRAENRARRSELEKRAQVLAESFQETVQPLLARSAYGNLQRILDRFGNRERLAGVAIYDSKDQPLLMTSNLIERLGPHPPELDGTVFQGNGWGHFFKSPQGDTHVYAVPVRSGGEVIGALAVFHDAS